MRGFLPSCKKLSVNEVKPNGWEYNELRVASVAVLPVVGVAVFSVVVGVACKHEPAPAAVVVAAFGRARCGVACKGLCK